MVSESYVQAVVRFKDKLVENKPYLSLKLDYSKGFLYDQAVKQDSLVKRLAQEVEEELKYELSEWQCSFAVGWAFQEQRAK